VEQVDDQSLRCGVRTGTVSAASQEKTTMVRNYPLLRGSIFALVGALAIGIYGPATAAPKGVSVGDAEQWAQAEKELQAKVKPLNDACGSSVAAGYDDKSYEGISIYDARANAACKQSFDALKEVCRTDIGKAAVKAKVKKFTCRFSKTGTKVTHSGTELVVHLDPKKTSIEGKQAGSYSWISALKELL
jgi:hypothetical protein